MIKYNGISKISKIIINVAIFVLCLENTCPNLLFFIEELPVDGVFVVFILFPKGVFSNKLEKELVDNLPGN